MGSNRILGVILLVGGLIVLALAYQGSQSYADQTKEFFTGNYRDRTNAMIVGGAVASVLGLIALGAPGRRSAD